MKKKILIIIILLIPFIIKAEEIKIDWNLNLNEINGHNGINKMILVEDNNIIIAGDIALTNETWKPELYDASIVKLNKNREIVWQQKWGGNSKEYFESIVYTKKSEIVSVGTSTSTDIEGISNKGKKDAVIVKYDKDGTLLWQKSWGGSGEECFHFIAETEKGELIVLGTTTSTDIDGFINNGESDSVIIKFDKDGNIIWQRNWGGNGTDSLNSLLINDEDFIAVGNTTSTNIEGIVNNGKADAVIVKFDKDGKIISQKNTGGTSGDLYWDIQKTEDNNYIICGQKTLDGSYNAAVIEKFDENFEMIWQQIWDKGHLDNYFSLLIKKNGDIITVGESLTGDYESRGIITKYNQRGNLICDKMYEEGAFYQILSQEEDSFYVQSEAFDITKYIIEYNLLSYESNDGTSIAIQQGSKGIITPTPNKGYEVDQIIIKDKNGDVLDLEITKLEDGTYSFPLYTDVSIKVTFKEKVENPKTGIIDIITILFIGIVISICGFILVKRYNERYEI